MAYSGTQRRSSAMRFVALLAFSLLCLSCGSGTPQALLTVPPANTAATNGMRDQLGLRLIDTQNWRFAGTTARDNKLEEVWKASKDGDEVKRVVYYKTGAILWEEDYYYSGKTFRPADAGEPAKERLTLHYEYLTRNMTLTYDGQDGAIRALFGQTGPGDSISSKELFPVGDIDHEKALADKVLGMWGVSRR